MTGVESAAVQPGEEPPAGVVCEILWRVAARLCRDHQPAASGAGTCAGCDRPWPCSGVRVARLGLSAAKG